MSSTKWWTQKLNTITRSGQQECKLYSRHFQNMFSYSTIDNFILRCRSCCIVHRYKVGSIGPKSEREYDVLCRSTKSGFKTECAIFVYGSNIKTLLKSNLSDMLCWIFVFSTPVFCWAISCLSACCPFSKRLFLFFFFDPCLSLNSTNGTTGGLWSDVDMNNFAVFCVQSCRSPVSNLLRCKSALDTSVMDGMFTIQFFVIFTFDILIANNTISHHLLPLLLHL